MCGSISLISEVLCPEMQPKTLKIVLYTLFFLFPTLYHSLPLSTNSRWIIEEPGGNRKKLTCVNWAAHLQPMLPEGIEKKPLKYIAEQVGAMGFNCVRLTWATYMFTRFSNRTVAESLDQLGLKQAMVGMTQYNPLFLNLTLVDAQKAVVDELGAHNIMVVLDNHVSLPKWCCSENDGNGFFGDLYFDSNEWLLGLTMVANRYKGNPAIVAMSLRNELRGPHQNETGWYKYIQEGATAIHSENPDVLVVVSGLSFETNLSFLKEKPLELNFSNKLVYEAHWYGFFNPKQKWLSETNEECANVTEEFIKQSAFVMMSSTSRSSNNPAPLFLSEFGVDQRGVNEGDNRYLGCLLSIMAERDIDWALWALQGSYMLREGQVDSEEVYGMFDVNWDHLRNSTVQQRLQLIKQMTQGELQNQMTENISFIMYHPQSGQCVQAAKDSFFTSDCQDWSFWAHHEDGGPIRLTDSSGCLTAVADGVPAIISDDCSSQKSMWKLVSSSKLHVAAQDELGRRLSFWKRWLHIIVTFLASIIAFTQHWIAEDTCRAKVRHLRGGMAWLDPPGPPFLYHPNVAYS
ncbi:unnamed protein product [Ilex paraguariensis]|uniref:Glycoside hydrolase family 5 domain-containing protein n=1 Tax=Ilex paraguariensis TaxID=185542 RepID=A0ABC8QW83_9AQUA